MMDCACRYDSEKSQLTTICGAHNQPIITEVARERKRILNDLEAWIKDSSNPILGKYGILYRISQLRKLR